MTLNTLTATLEGIASRARAATRTILEQKAVITEQREVIQQQRVLIDTLIRTGSESLNRVSLAHLLEMEGVVAGWLLHCEHPEIDPREGLLAALQRLSDQRATLEEHVC